MRAVRSAAISAALALAAALPACGGGAVLAPDPQEPAPAPQKGQPMRPSQIVICPDGATYDPTHNTCLATGAITAGPARASAEAAAPVANSSINVRCTFRDGWVSVLPADAYPNDDTFLMQALIGFAQDPDFWQGQSEYSALERFAARRCADAGQKFDLASGDYFIVVGQSGTYSRKGSYDRNGYRRRVRVAAGIPQIITLRQADLTVTWSCISCPFVSFVDSSTGRYLPAIVVLAWRNSPSRRGTDKVLVERVPVRDGKLRLRVAEAEQEVSHIDQLVLEVGGNVLLPLKGGERSALAAIDGVGVDMAHGTEITVEYSVPGMKDGTVDVHVIAHGYYDPL